MAPLHASDCIYLLNSHSSQLLVYSYLFYLFRYYIHLIRLKKGKEIHSLLWFCSQNVVVISIARWPIDLPVFATLWCRPCAVHHELKMLCLSLNNLGFMSHFFPLGSNNNNPLYLLAFLLSPFLRCIVTLIIGNGITGFEREMTSMIYPITRIKSTMIPF